MKRPVRLRRLAWLGAVLLAGDGAFCAASEAVPAARRDPFWPIGYRPPARQPTAPVAPRATPEFEATESQWQQAERDVGIHPPRYSFAELGGEARVVVQGRLLSVGETVQFRGEGILFRWRVLAVFREGVRFERLTAEPAAVQEDAGAPR